MGTQIATAGTQNLSGPAAQSQTPPALAMAAAYYASKPAMMQPLYNMRPTGPQNPMLTSVQAVALINQCIAAGLLIDEEIDFWGWDPYTIMSDRLRQGILWVPAGLGAIDGTDVITPGEFSGAQPVGTIKSSVTLSDYPPAVAPPANPPSSSAAGIGALIYGPYYQPTPGTLPAMGTGPAGYKLTQIPSGFMIGDGSMMTVFQKLS